MLLKNLENIFIYFNKIIDAVNLRFYIFRLTEYIESDSKVKAIA